ncbi:MAG: DUF5684 domain-containing protein [Actinomycetia bacterium]|nr:DUF5684 domain-containing protein [Actinomycetes bacterium]
MQAIDPISGQLSPGATAGLTASFVGGYIIGLAIAVLMIIACWKIFTKAGKPGWTAIIPVLNVLQLLDLAGKPWWWIILLCIPIVNIVVLFLVNLEVAKAFGKSTVFGILLTILAPICYLILGFGPAQYQRPATWPATWLNI